MREIKTKKIFNYFNSFVKNNFKFKVDKMFTFFAGSLIIIPLIYLLFIIFSSIMLNVSIMDFLHKDASTDLMVIISFVNFVFGYFIFIKKKILLNNKKLLKLFVSALVVSQLITGNLLIFFLGLLLLYSSSKLPTRDEKIKKNYIVLLVFGCFIYFLSAIFLVFVSI